MTSYLLTAITLLQLINVILLLAFFVIGFKLLETSWSYKISKPFAWDEGVRKKTISKKLRSIERFTRDKVRFYALWFQVERLKREKISGAFAELGVYKGVTARMIHAMDPVRTFHLFDTFQGFDPRDIIQEKVKDPGQGIDFSDTTVESVLNFIDGNGNVVVHPGYFPDTAEALSEQRYALVHIDADLYKPTLAALKHFYPRLAEGGVILVHDYNHSWSGVTQAVDEFTTGIDEGMLELPDWQGSVLIIKNRNVSPNQTTQPQS